jgi:hypothetical protein
VFFPELSYLAQPIGGIFSARHDLLTQLEFEPDYGVDVGLLIDAQMQAARIAQVDVGLIEHDSQSLPSLGQMAQQVVRVILSRASTYGRLDPLTLAEMREAERHLHAGLLMQSSSHPDPRPIVVLAIDNVVLEGELLRQMALHLGRADILGELDRLDSHDPEQLRQKAALFNGATRKEIETVARLINLRDGVVDTVKELRRLGYRVALVGDLFHSAIEILRRRVYAHMCFAHVGSRAGKNEIIEGLKFSAEFSYPAGCQEHQLCPGNVVLNMRDHYNLPDDQIVAVGYLPRDACLLGKAGRRFSLYAGSLSDDGSVEVLEGNLRDLPQLLLNGQSISLPRSA